VHRSVPADPETADVTVKLDNTSRLLAVAFGDLASPGLDISGDYAALQAFVGALDRPDPAFTIMTP